MVDDERDIAGGLQRAVDRGEIVAWFQPQVDLRTHHVVAAEALCRWFHPVWGLLGPAEFIPIAEETGVIDEIGQYMAERACAAMVEWAIDVSVNVSPAQLESAAFTIWLGRLLRRIHPSRRTLTLEITEGRRLVDVPAVVARLDRLRALGVGVAIDDFGMGQASLTQLKRLHGTELKIDRGLVADDSPEASDLLADAVALAHEAEIRVVAEGVETGEHLERVIRLGCDRAQGFLLGRPMPGAQLTRLLETA